MKRNPTSLADDRASAARDRAHRQQAGRARLWHYGAILIAVTLTVTVLELRLNVYGPFLYIPIIAALAYAGGRLVGTATALLSILCWWYVVAPNAFSFNRTGNAPSVLEVFVFVGLAVAIGFGSVRDLDRRRKQAERARLDLAAIVESSDDAILSKTMDGIILTWNAGAERLYGYTPQDVIGRSVSMLAAPESPDEIPAIMARLSRGEVIRHYETVRVKKDGTRFDVSLTISPVRDDSGRIIGASAVARDVSDRKRAERGQQFLTQASEALSRSLNMEATLEAMAQLIVPTLANWCTIDLVEEAGHLHRRVVVHEDPAKLTLARELEQQHPFDRNSAYGIPSVMRTGEPALHPELTEDLLTVMVGDPERRRVMQGLGLKSMMIVPLIVRSRTLGTITLVTAESGRRYDAGDLALAVDLGRRAAFAVDNARLYQAEQATRRTAEQAADQIGRLQLVTAALSEALTPTQVAEVILHAVIDVLGAGAAAVIGLDGAESPILVSAIGYSADIHERWRRSSGDITAIADAMRTGHVVWYASWADFQRQYPNAIVPSEPCRLGARAAVPFAVHGRMIGALYMNFAECRQLDNDELQFMLTLGRRCGAAMERARLYEREHTVAETLQRSLLPAHLPDLPGIQIAARYYPAARDARIGGDWYDALALPDGRIGVVIGDVAGRGLPAASVMARLRGATRAYAMESGSPDALVQRLRLMVDRGEMVTLIYLILDPIEQTVTYANAGHPAPLLIAPDGRSEFLPGGSIPLCQLPAPYQAFTATVPDGSTLLLYTDGLVEDRSRQTIDQGLARLRRLVEQARDRTPDTLVEHIVSAVSTDRALDDDVAVLAVSVDMADRRRLVLHLPATPDAVQRVRLSLRRWLAAARVEPARIQEIITASCEACTNAVEHAYTAADAHFAFEATREGDDVTILVRDQGHWRSPRPGRRGFGLALMRALMDTVEIERGGDGTTVRFRTRLTGGVRA